MKTQNAAVERIGGPVSRTDATATFVDADSCARRLTNLSFYGKSVMRHVVLRPEAARQLDELPKSMRARIHTVLARLQQWPEVSGAKPLTGKLAGHFRVRTGDYRIQFSVTPETLIVERVGHRDGFYKG